MEHKDRVRQLAEGVIFNIQRFSIHDGPGIRTTVFLKGCPLHCSWCHNPESQALAPVVMHRSDLCSGCGSCLSACSRQALSMIAGLQTRQNCTGCGACVAVCPQGALELVGRQATDAEVLGELLKDEAFYEQSGGGVTFSGGEPLVQSDFLRSLLQQVRGYQWHTTVDTSGYAPWPVIAELLPLVDLWLYDLKLMDDAVHQQFTGVSNRLILDNLQRLVQARAKVEIRVPVIPGVNDYPANWARLQQFLRPLPIGGVKLLAYHSYGAEKYGRLGLEYQLGSTPVPSEQRMTDIKQLLQSGGLPVM